MRGAGLTARRGVTVEGRSEGLQTLSYLVGRAILARPMRHAE